MGSTTGSIIITVKGKEVYVGTAPPSSPVDNELWLDISENNVLKYYKASTKTWCVVNDVSEKFGDVYKYLQTNYYTKTETNSAVKEEIGKTTIIKKDGTVVNMKDAINSVIDTATEHTQKIEDINSKYNSVTGEITSVKTIATQTANKFNWLVKSGTSATDFTLTDRTATLVSDYINLKGLVTFSGLNSDAQNKINTANTTANSANTKAQGIIDNIYTKNTTTIDGGKIATESIKASSIDVNNLFAQDITATGTITGLTLRGTQLYTNEGEIAGLTIKDNSLYHRWYDSVQNGNSITHFYFDDMGISSLFEEGSKKLWIGAHPKIYSADYVDSDGKVMDENMEYPFYVTYEGYLFSKTGNIAGYDFNSDGFYSQFTTNSRKTQRFAIKSNAKYTEPGTPFIGLQDENEAFKWFYVKTDGSGYFTNLEVSEDIQSSGDVIAGLGTSNQVSLQGLKDTTTRIRGKSIFSINNYGVGASKKGSSVSLWKDSATLTHGFYIAIISAVISTNTGTSRIELLANGNALMAARTNSTTYERVLAVHNFGVSGEQSFNFELVAKSQDASSTVTVPGYRTYSVLIFKIG